MAAWIAHSAHFVCVARCARRHPPGRARQATSCAPCLRNCLRCERPRQGAPSRCPRTLRLASCGTVTLASDSSVKGAHKSCFQPMACDESRSCAPTSLAPHTSAARPGRAWHVRRTAHRERRARRRVACISPPPGGGPLRPRGRCRPQAPSAHTHGHRRRASTADKGGLLAQLLRAPSAMRQPQSAVTPLGVAALQGRCTDRRLRWPLLSSAQRHCECRSSLQLMDVLVALPQHLATLASARRA